MNKFFLLALLFISYYSNAQWTPQNSGVTVKLNDIDFLNQNFGIAGGDSGVVLITLTGGSQWTSIYVGTYDNIGTVKMISPDTLLVSYVDANHIPHMVYSYNSGIYWQPLATDSFCYRALDTDNGDDGKWVTTGSSLVSTVNGGTSWDTLMNFTCDINNINRIQNVDSIYNAGGIISGFATYSASMLRSEDRGNHFYAYGAFFPNADALTAFDFPSPDTGFVFMNKYAGFVPGSRNSVVKVYNFQLYSPFPNDTEFSFTSAILDTTIPSYINDGKFFGEHGFIVCENGVIYESITGGTSWNQTYSTGGSTLTRVSFPNDVTGYAVGDHGTILKYSPTTGINETKSVQLFAYPNPVNSILNLPGLSNEVFKITDVSGRIISSGKIIEEKIELSSLAKGIYFVYVKAGDKMMRTKILKE
jgi:photosystem II stability/assembly factor-like uncharacterized protein